MPNPLTIDTTSSCKNSWFASTYVETHSRKDKEFFCDEYANNRDEIIQGIKDRHAEEAKPEDEFAISKINSGINTDEDDGSFIDALP